MRNHLILTAALASLAAFSSAVETNVLLGKSVTSINGNVSYNNHVPTAAELGTVTDGLYAPRGDAWYNSICWNDVNRMLEIDLAGTYTLTKMNGQFDDNEAYRVDYLGLDSAWHTAWNVANMDFDPNTGHNLAGMQSRPERRRQRRLVHPCLADYRHQAPHLGRRRRQRLCRG